MNEASCSIGRMTLITGVERRRRWSNEDRARILAAKISRAIRTIEEPEAEHCPEKADEPKELAGNYQ